MFMSSHIYFYRFCITILAGQIIITQLAKIGSIQPNVLQEEDILNVKNVDISQKDRTKFFLP